MGNTPNIRFKGFTDDWEQRKLGEICQRVIRKNKNNESDLPLTIASQYGLIDQRDFFNKVVAAKDMSNYYLLRKGEFAYNKSYSNGFEYGSIKRLNAYEQGCLSTLYICFEITSDEVDSDYLECFFDTLKWYGDLSMICAEGARNHGLLNVDIKAFFADINVSTPTNLKEQRKIATYLNNLDHLITLHQRKCDETKKLKKFMLQKMFPKKDAKKPEIRFAGFTDDWEQRKLSEVAEIVGGGTPSTNIPEYWDGDIDWYAPAEINDQIYVDGSERKITKLGLEKSSAKILPADITVLFTSRAGIGKTAILRRSGATNQGFQSMVLNDETNPYFVFSISKFIKEEAERVASGSTFAEVSGKMLGNLAFMFPTKKEQDKIGEYFSNLDNLITLHRRAYYNKKGGLTNVHNDNQQHYAIL